MATLTELRARIDAIDAQLQALINERAQLAQHTAQTKQAQGESGDIYRPEREAQVLRNIAARQSGVLSAEDMTRLFREIMSTCRAAEQVLSVAFLGPAGTYTQAAALKHFGHAVQSVPHATIAEVFRDVESGTAHYGVVPVENSTEGVVNHTLDRFVNSPLKICGEVELRIHHNLLATSPDRATVQRVYAHQQALAQCRQWLDEHLPGIERIAVNSNAEAARRAAQEDASAAIASDVAAEIYGLVILAANIEDEPDNTTRFLVIGAHSPCPSGNDKTSLLLSAQNQPGALCRLLEPLARHGVSMTRIESRPSRRGMWDYVFFVDIEGHSQIPPVATALQELQREAAMLRVLGSYPSAVL